jgi:hypothetical protein
MPERWIGGGCHCGAVRFRVRVREARPIVHDCNCSICNKKGFLHLIVSPEDFVLERGSDALSLYEFNTRIAKHRFCKLCGTHPFYTPRSHPDRVDVNVRCLDGDAPASFEIQPFDGRRWEENVGSIRGAGR